MYPARALTADPDQPVPFTLTAKAHAALGQEDTPAAPGPDEWACSGCGDAWFGQPPEGGLCPSCRPGQDHP